jgi:hypothetical protein
MARPNDEHPDLPAKEAARIRARDRRRTTRMVVDNAAVKRVVLDRARARQVVAAPAEAPGGGPPPRQ